MRYNNQRRVQVRYATIMPVFMVLLILCGCQTMPAPMPEPPPPAVPIVIEPEPEPPVEPLATDLKTVIELMQNGQDQLAIDSLMVLIDDTPNASTMQKLLAQLQTNPSDFFGAEFFEVDVVAGDTLSTLANTHLGDPLLFFALARYNGITIPKHLEKDRRLKIPRDYAGKLPLEQASAGVIQSGLNNHAIDERSNLERIADFFVAGGDSKEAWETLLQASDAGTLSDYGAEQLFTLSKQLTDQAYQDGNVDLAITTLEQSISKLPDGQYADGLQSRLVRIQANELLQRSNTVSQSGDIEGAWRLASEASSIDPGFQLASDRAITLRTQLVDELHGNALRYWRDREIGNAILLWQKLLDIEPDFEPASVYLERARELERKFNSGAS